MKKVTLLLSLLLMCGHMSFANTSSTLVQMNENIYMTLKNLIAKGLPVLYVTTVDGEEPTCEIVSAPAGSWGSTINAEKVPGRLVIYDNIDGVDSVLYDSGDYEKDVSGMTIRVRGNSSARPERKPYKIKLQKKRDLLFRGVDSVYKDKEWVLLRDNNMYTSTAFFISKMVDMIWVPGHRYVNLVINDVYRGMCLLTESVKRNPDCRLNVDKHSGFIFECDIYWWNEPVYVYSNDNPSYNYTFKYPDEDDITEEQLAYMQSLVYALDSSLTADNYPDLIDVRSWAKWCLVHDIMGIKDGGGCNRFYTKYDTTAESKIYMPLAWDFDMAERTPNAWSRCHTVYMKKLFNNSNKAFVHEYIRAWCMIRDNFIDEVMDHYDELVASDLGHALDNCFYLYDVIWGDDLWFEYLALWRHQWLQERYAWLDTNIMAMHVPNDVNIDGQVSISDVTELINMLLGNSPRMVTGDISGDGNISITDVTELINLLLAN